LAAPSWQDGSKFSWHKQHWNTCFRHAGQITDAKKFADNEENDPEIDVHKSWYKALPASPFEHS
jgi:hypothetical protein